jgi:hypothetical protein
MDSGFWTPRSGIQYAYTASSISFILNLGAKMNSDYKAFKPILYFFSDLLAEMNLHFHSVTREKRSPISLFGNLPNSEKIPSS